ncbi:MAG: L,D-transpeptidase family protein [Streptosporangiaceae bacterium]
MFGRRRPARRHAAGGPQQQPEEEATQAGQDQEVQPRRSKAPVIALAAGAAAVVVAAVAYFGLTHSGAGQSAAQMADRAHVASPLAVRSVLPGDGSTHANGGEPVEIKFSVPLAAGSPTPVLTPAVRGRWSIAGSSMVFTPARPFGPRTRVTVRIPGGRSGVRSATGRLLSAPVTVRFRTGQYASLRLAQVLAQLGYLPLHWSPGMARGASAALTVVPGGSAAASSLAGQAAMAYDPPAGQFSWNPGYPYALHRQWRAGQPNLIIKGAVMAFQSQHGMPVNGKTSPAFWRALFKAAAAGQGNAHGYTYALARQAAPETLTIWHNGHVVLHTLANTGIPVSPTANGTFPVYLRYRFQIMRGVNPDGSAYADPVSFVSYFNGGDAVHYFPRASYGFQQSLGCVELPYGAAEQAYPYLTYGSLVTVTG